MRLPHFVKTSCGTPSRELLPHFVKTSCGTPSRELFHSGLPAHRHRREGWLGRTRGDGGVPPFPFWEICDFPKWLQNIDNVLRHKYVSLFVQSVRIPNKKYPCGVFFIWLGRTDSNHDKENQNLLSYH